MKKIARAAAVALTLGSVSLAMAGAPENQLQALPKGGFFVGGSAGWGALLTTKFANEAGVDTVVNKEEPNGFAGRAKVGYLFDLKNGLLLGAEGGYTYLPQSKLTLTTQSGDSAEVTQTLNYKDYALDVLAVAKYYVNNKVNLFAKAGAAYVKQELKYTASANHVKMKRDRVMPEVAVGAAYALLDSLEATVTYTHGFGDSLDATKLRASLGNTDSMKADANKIPDFNTVMLGINYYFA